MTSRRLSSIWCEGGLFNAHFFQDTGNGADPACGCYFGLRSGLASMAIDSSFRVEYLLAGLQNRYSPHADAVDRLKIDPNAQVAVLTGVAEITPFPCGFRTLVGSISVWERSGSFARPRDHRLPNKASFSSQPPPPAKPLTAGQA